jgi:hypothetical protein
VCSVGFTEFSYSGNLTESSEKSLARPGMTDLGHFRLSPDVLRRGPSPHRESDATTKNSFTSKQLRVVCGSGYLTGA